MNSSTVPPCASAASAGGQRSERKRGSRRRKSKCERLPDDYEPGVFDVVCGRGNESFFAPGNVKFRAAIKSHLQGYLGAGSKWQKTQVVTSVITTVEANKGKFIRRSPTDGGWCIEPKPLAREKISSTFRDCLHFKYISSSKAKNARRANKHNTQQMPEEAKQSADSVGLLDLLSDAAAASVPALGGSPDEDAACSLPTQEPQPAAAAAAPAASTQPQRQFPVVNSPAVAGPDQQQQLPATDATTQQQAPPPAVRSPAAANPNPRRPAAAVCLQNAPPPATRLINPQQQHSQPPPPAKPAAATAIKAPPPAATSHQLPPYPAAAAQSPPEAHQPLVVGYPSVAAAGYRHPNPSYHHWYASAAAARQVPSTQPVAAAVAGAIAVSAKPTPPGPTATAAATTVHPIPSQRPGAAYLGYNSTRPPPPPSTVAERNYHWSASAAAGHAAQSAALHPPAAPDPYHYAAEGRKTAAPPPPPGSAAAAAAHHQTAAEYNYHYHYWRNYYHHNPDQAASHLQQPPQQPQSPAPAPAPGHPPPPPPLPQPPKAVLPATQLLPPPPAVGALPSGAAAAPPPGQTLCYMLVPVLVSTTAVADAADACRDEEPTGEHGEDNGEQQHVDQVGNNKTCLLQGGEIKDDGDTTPAMIVSSADGDDQPYDVADEVNAEGSSTADNGPQRESDDTA